ncbi:hypothetical protein AKJ09_05153 [Labilithrix luteola]|uniref:Uncharacterized protein n=1 Tax=Labilithrix luteola TaxID=1391654 RepID=A0A0K1PZA7_9BACT|nr:hypothetical protein [Labilithrix luteola]AKU98489.1 hypothetical protein AKJ09_05153 [Labilithrix luteola]
MLSVVAGCGLVLGLEDHDLDPRSSTAGGDATADGAPDGTPDGSLAPSPDAVACASSPSKTCTAVGMCCPDATPFCRLNIDLPNKTFAVSCAAQADVRQIGEECDPIAGQCADGLSCGLVYSTSVMYTCVPLCTSDADCAPCAEGRCSYDTKAGGFCSHPLAKNSTVKQCGACDPMAPGNACGADYCLPQDLTGPPSCGRGGFDTGCHWTADCPAGQYCICGSGFGNACGYAPTAGSCMKGCYIYDVGKPCPTGGTCTAIAGGANYAICK